MSGGWSGVYLFTWHVFRPGPGWARTLALGGVGVLFAAGFAGVVRGVMIEDLAQLRAASPSGLVLVLAAEAVYGWTTIEAVRYRALLKRRIPLGLADPLVADRFGLWAWTSVFGFASLVPSVFATVTGGDPNTTASRLVRRRVRDPEQRGALLRLPAPRGLRRASCARTPRAPEPSGGL